jgi:hypothetical protein
VRDEHHAEALAAETPHELQHLLGLRDAEGCGRLVETTSFEFHITARATATTGAGRREGRHRLADRPDRRDRQGLEGLGRLLLHRRSE